jgi:hypothetical protein
MPSERIYTIRGQSPAATLTHEKLQLSSFDPKMSYQIVEFKIMPAGSPTNTDCYGTISMGKNDNIDPSNPNFTNQNEIAWAHHTVQQPVPPGIAESVTTSYWDLVDEKLFSYDIWIHTIDTLGAENINWYIKIRKYSVSANTGSVTSLRQYQYNDQQNQ